jgi:hypothetical protein
MKLHHLFLTFGYSSGSKLACALPGWHQAFAFFAVLAFL